MSLQNSGMGWDWKRGRLKILILTLLAQLKYSSHGVPTEAHEPSPLALTGCSLKSIHFSIDWCLDYSSRIQCTSWLGPQFIRLRVSVTPGLGFFEAGLVPDAKTEGKRQWFAKGPKGVCVKANKMGTPKSQVLWFIFNHLLYSSAALCCTYMRVGHGIFYFRRNLIENLGNCHKEEGNNNYQTKQSIFPTIITAGRQKNIPTQTLLISKHWCRFLLTIGSCTLGNPCALH